MCKEYKFKKDIQQFFCYRNSWPRYKTVDSNDFEMPEGPDDSSEIDDDDDSQNGITKY